MVGIKFTVMLNLEMVTDVDRFGYTCAVCLTEYSAQVSIRLVRSEFLATDTEVSGSIPGAPRFSE